MTDNEFYQSHDRLIFSATNCQRVLDTRVHRAWVRPGSIELSFSPSTGKANVCRVQVLKDIDNREVAEYSLVSIPKLIDSFLQFRERIQLTTYKRVVRSGTVQVLNQQSGKAYLTSRNSCTCGSYITQVEQAAYFELYCGEDFKPRCKHQSWLEFVERTPEVISCFWMPDPKSEQLNVLVYIWPCTQMKSPHGHVCKANEISFYGKYPIAQLDMIADIATARGWKFERFYPYGVPMQRLMSQS